MALRRPTCAIPKAKIQSFMILEQKTSFEESKRPENHPRHRRMGCDPKRPIGIHFGEEGKVILVPGLLASLKKHCFLKSRGLWILSFIVSQTH